VGPVYNTSKKNECAELLASCYRSSLQLASEHDQRHIVSTCSHHSFSSLHILQAFPAISTGVYGYPVEDAARIALGEAREFCESEAGAKVLDPYSIRGL
jgi:O-acetyl-ADP-ribose deacetylase (regulator of RNase III)